MMENYSIVYKTYVDNFTLNIFYKEILVLLDLKKKVINSYKKLLHNFSCFKRHVNVYILYDITRVFLHFILYNAYMSINPYSSEISQMLHVDDTGHFYSC